jgi:inosine triphosphate pyrophosphatase
MYKIAFVTGNDNKFKEAKAIVDTYEDFDGQVELIQLKVDLPEIQGSSEDIVKFKLEEAHKYNGVTGHKFFAFIIEDTSLEFNALGGMPGVYIKWFLEKTGVDNLVKMLSVFEDKSAYACCTFGYKSYDPSSEPIMFEGRVLGQIVEPTGFRSFGWDCIFKPDGYTQTYAEMDKSVKNKISPRSLAFTRMLKHIEASMR